MASKSWDSVMETLSEITMAQVAVRRMVIEWDSKLMDFGWLNKSESCSVRDVLWVVMEPSMGRSAGYWKMADELKLELSKK